MRTGNRSAVPRRDEWSVTLNGRYVVRFSGANAQENARRQLRELAELLGFDGQAETAETAEDTPLSTPAVPGDQR